MAADFCFLGGGEGNSIQTNAYESVLGGGWNNSIQANAYFSFLGGGTNNFIQPNAFDATLGGGANNQVGGAGATVPGGNGNAANGVNSFAAGTDAQALYNGDFVLTDCHYTDFASTAANQFCARFYGGYQLYSGASSGVQVAAGGGSWTSLSDRNAKEAFEPVNAQVVLDKVAALPLSTWKDKSQDASIRHIGPMAQDFKAAFGVGETDTGITTVDADGVALAAIQGLNRKLEETVKQKDAEIQADISHVVSCPRTAWVVFVIFCLLPDYASLFSSPLSVFVRRGRCFDAIVGSNAIFLLEVKTPPPFVP